MASYVNFDLYSEQGKEYLREEYNKKGRSPYDISVELGTYPNKIRRALTHHGIHIRDKSEAQAAALKNGKAKHPTEGSKRPPQVRKRISENVAEAYGAAPEEAKLKRATLAKQNWEAMPEKERQSLQNAAQDGIRRAARDGSKIEQYLLNGLRLHGYKVNYHHSMVVSAEQMHVDLFLPELGVAIEIDGPTHFLPVWSEEQLQKNREADIKKNGLLLNEGYVVLRVKNLDKNLSEFKLGRLLRAVVAQLTAIAQSFPPLGERLIYMEI